MNEQNTFFDNLKNKFNSLSPEMKKGIIIATAIIILILGIFMGCKANVSHSDYNAALDELETAKQETAKIEQEYKEYKEKMQPYESIQLADAENKAEQERLNIEKQKQEQEAQKAAAEKAAAEEKAQKEAEEKAAAEAKAAAEKAAAEAKAAEEAKGYETGITFDNLARTPDEYKGKKVKFTGKVIQVIEGTSETQLRLAVNGSYDKIIFCRVPKAKTASTRILEDDYIHIMGVSNGLISYQSTMGGTITIPDISVDDWGQN